MKNLYDLIKLNILLIALAIIAAGAIQANGNGKTDRYKNAIVAKLTEKLRTDLADRTVEVKLNELLRDKSISENRVDVDGKALAVVKDDRTALPLQFTAKVDVARQNVEEVSYKFVADTSEFAPSAAEDSLMKELMAKISRDYETTNIVISIDGFDTAPLTATETKYEGLGEVRIGDFEWRRIKFNVVLDSQNQTATKILYDVQK